MDSFLQRVTNHIFETHGDDFENLCVVTPNRRAGLFLKKHFSKKITRATWAPTFLSIEDFANKISGCSICDNLGLVFMFWEVYKKSEGSNAKSIEDFLGWAPMLLRDFDEIDCALDDPAKLFSYLRDFRYIQTWNPDGSPLTKFQRDYLDFFGRIEIWHLALKQQLEKSGSAYQGMSFRKTASIIKNKSKPLAWKKVVFAGFNALTNAEETIISYLVNEGAAEVILDSDPYYEEDPWHEAGHFIRKYRVLFKIPKDANQHSNFASCKKINILGVPRNFNQAQLAGNILGQNSNVWYDEQTAIVLANENLLIPVLNSLPQNIEAINVTMGYPLWRTNLFSFFDSLVQLHITSLRLSRGKDNPSPKYYYKDLVRFFSNSCTPFLQPVNEKLNIEETLLPNIRLSNRTFYTFGQILELAGIYDDKAQVFSFLTENWANSPAMAIKGLRSLCWMLDKAFREKAISDNTKLQRAPYFIDFEAIYYFEQVCNRVETAIEKTHGRDLTLEILWQVMKQACKETRIALSGEPVEGLQVMGMLETRNLDFKNLIVISVNEGMLPKGKSDNTFLPFEVRRKFGLQIHTDKDSVYAYHFYRLLQRAENTFLIYNTEPGTMGSNEQSRFITQICHELPEFNPASNVTHSMVALAPELQKSQKTISIEKTPEVMKKLVEIGEKGFSPSALNTYIRCPLKFYLEKVAGISEAEVVEETLEATTFGNVVHGVLEDLFSPIKGRVIGHGDIAKMREKLTTLTALRFEEHYSQGDVSTGKNLLLFELAKRQIERFLEKENEEIEKLARNNAYLTVLETEKRLEATLPIEVSGRKILAKIAGKADRIDKKGNTVRIIDYKTGKVEARDLSVNDLHSIAQDPKLDKVFQLLTYEWLFRKNNETNLGVTAGIISLRNLQDLLEITFNQDNIENPLLVFEEQLKGLLQLILNPEEPFSQAANEENCKYCSFQAMCGRFIEDAGF